MEIMPPPPEIIAQWIKDDEIKKAKQFLQDTDWYITRQIETGKEVPVEILEQRAAARAAASL